MKSVVALVFLGLAATTFAAPSGLLGVGLGHGVGVPLATSALVAGPSGVISSHQSNGAIAVAAPALVASPAVVSVAGHGLGLGLAGHGLGGIGLNGIGLGGIGLGGLGLGLGHGIHGW